MPEGQRGGAPQTMPVLTKKTENSIDKHRVVVYCLTLATVVLGLSCVSRVKGSRGQGEHDVVALQSAESTSNPNR